MSAKRRSTYVLTDEDRTRFSAFLEDLPVNGAADITPDRDVTNDSKLHNRLLQWTFRDSFSLWPTHIIFVEDKNEDFWRTTYQVLVSGQAFDGAGGVEMIAIHDGSVLVRLYKGLDPVAVVQLRPRRTRGASVVIGRIGTIAELQRRCHIALSAKGSKLPSLEDRTTAWYVRLTEENPDHEKARSATLTRLNNGAAVIREGAYQIANVLRVDLSDITFDFAELYEPPETYGSDRAEWHRNYERFARVHRPQLQRFYSVKPDTKVLSALIMLVRPKFQVFLKFKHKLPGELQRKALRWFDKTASVLLGGAQKEMMKTEILRAHLDRLLKRFSDKKLGIWVFLDQAVDGGDPANRSFAAFVVADAGLQDCREELPDRLSPDSDGSWQQLNLRSQPLRR